MNQYRKEIVTITARIIAREAVERVTVFGETGDPHQGIIDYIESLRLSGVDEAEVEQITRVYNNRYQHLIGEERKRLEEMRTRTFIQNLEVTYA